MDTLVLETGWLGVSCVMISNQECGYDVSNVAYQLFYHFVLFVLVLDFTFSPLNFVTVMATLFLWIFLPFVGLGLMLLSAFRVLLRILLLRTRNWILPRYYGYLCI